MGKDEILTKMNIEHRTSTNIERPTSNVEWEKMKTYDPGRKAANYCRRWYISILQPLT